MPMKRSPSIFRKSFFTLHQSIFSFVTQFHQNTREEGGSWISGMYVFTLFSNGSYYIRRLKREFKTLLKIHQRSIKIKLKKSARHPKNILI